MRDSSNQKTPSKDGLCDYINSDIRSSADEWQNRIDDDAILVVDVFEKKTERTPHQIIANCQRRLRLYDSAAGGEQI